MAVAVPLCRERWFYRCDSYYIRVVADEEMPCPPGRMGWATTMDRWDKQDVMIPRYQGSIDVV